MEMHIFAQDSQAQGHGFIQNFIFIPGFMSKIQA